MDAFNPGVRSWSMAVVLALTFAALVIYASLYPFAGWYGPGIGLGDLLGSPLPQYWTWFDVCINAAGYAPLGFFVSFAMWRSGTRWGGAVQTVIAGTALCSLLSLFLEWGQSFLPGRIPSNVDWALNSLGSLLGASIAVAVAQTSWISRWDRWRRTWLVPGAKAEVVLLVLWPVAALYPSAVPYGLGHVRMRLAIVDVSSWDMPSWVTAPFYGLHQWAVVPQFPMSGMQEALTMALAVLAPSLLACAAARGLRVRMWSVVAVWAIAAGVGLLSGALTYGASHALDWWRPNMWLAWVMLVGGTLVTLRLSRAALLRLLVLVVVLTLVLLNTSGPSAYLDQSLHIWQAGQFFRFHGASQWLGWVWPFLVLGYLVLRLPSLR